MSAEILVYGATAGGVAAAVAAARMGSAVVLLEPGRHVGGMVSGRLGYTDLGDAAACRTSCMYGRRAAWSASTS